MYNLDLPNGPILNLILEELGLAKIGPNLEKECRFKHATMQQICWVIECDTNYPKLKRGRNKEDYRIFVIFFLILD